MTDGEINLHPLWELEERLPPTSVHNNYRSHDNRLGGSSNRILVWPPSLTCSWALDNNVGHGFILVLAVAVVGFIARIDMLWDKFKLFVSGSCNPVDGDENEGW